MARRSVRNTGRRFVQVADGRPKPLMFLLLVALGTALIVTGWIVASGKTHFDDQLPALNLGIVGTVVILAACALYLLTYRRVIRSRTALLRGEPAVGSLR